jgi:hypothetical protein
MKKMKKLIIFSFLILTVLSCKAQILPIENLIDYIEAEDTGIPENITYIKDVNNLLDKYIGTWIGSYDNKTYEFIIVKVTRDLYGTMEDKLEMRYKITDTNGAVIENTTFLPDDSPFIIKGSYLARTAFYVLTYIGQEADCGQHGDLFIAVGYHNDNNIMKASLSVIGDLILASDCPNGEAEQILPTEQFTLTKQ